MRSHRTIDELVGEEIAAAVLNGQTMAAVARHFGCSHATVRKSVSGRLPASQYPSSTPTKILQSTRMQVAADYLDGVTQDAICVKHGLSEASVARILKQELPDDVRDQRAGIKRSPAFLALVKKRHDDIVAKVRAGTPPKVVARQTYTSISRVRQITRKRGINMYDLKRKLRAKK